MWVAVTGGMIERWNRTDVRFAVGHLTVLVRPNFVKSWRSGVRIGLRDHDDNDLNHQSEENINFREDKTYPGLILSLRSNQLVR